MSKRYTIRFLAGLAFLCVGLLSANAQAPDSLWAKTHGGADDDRGYAIVQTSDGGFAVTAVYGSYEEAGLPRGGDVWLVRTDANADTIWTRIFEGPGIDEANTVRQTSDGGFVVGGAQSDFRGIYEAWLARTDSDGDTLWTNTYGEGGEEWINDVHETSDGGFVFAGVLNSGLPGQQAWLVRTDSDGILLWSTSFGGDGEDIGHAVRETSDGGFILTGSTREIGENADLWLIRTDENGDELWSKTYNGSNSFNDVDAGLDLRLMSEDGALVLGHSGVSVWLLRTDVDGDTLWTSQFFGDPSAFDLTPDGGTVIVGGSWVYRTDDAGELLWSKSMAGAFNAVARTDDGGYMLAGYTQPWMTASEELLLVRLAAETSTAIGDETPTQAFDLLSIYPNPFRGSTTIDIALDRRTDVRLAVYDVTGRAVRTLVAGAVAAGRHSVTWDGRGDDGSRLASGTYFFRMGSAGAVKTRTAALIW